MLLFPVCKNQNFQKLLLRTPSNGLDQDQDLYFVGPDLDPNSLQRLLAKQGKS